MQNCEWRISIYGRFVAPLSSRNRSFPVKLLTVLALFLFFLLSRNVNEWDKLAKWIVNNKLVSHNVRWLVQVPRLYDIYKAGGLIENFQDIIRSECFL